MENETTRIDGRALAHIVGRAGMALAIGWGYLALIFAFDVAGAATWAGESRWAPVIIAEAVVIIGVMFGVTGARIGYRNVYGA